MNKDRLFKLGFVIMTKEYVGGIIGGFGVGILGASVIFSPEHRVGLAMGLAACCTMAGSFLARAGQRQKFQKNGIDEKH